MTSTDELRYIQAYARVIGVKEDEAIQYAQRKGITSLVDNASQLLTTQTQRQKHKAFLDLYRMSSAIQNNNPQITTPETAAAFFHSVMEKIYDQEAFAVAFLNTKNRVIDHEIVSLGTINSSIVHPREVFRHAILNKARAIVMCHNHPSGDLTPSSEDQSLTQRLKEIGTLIGISVIDHVIINGVTRNDVFSFRQNGIMETPSDYKINSSVSDGRASCHVPLRQQLKKIEDKMDKRKMVPLKNNERER